MKRPLFLFSIALIIGEISAYFTNSILFTALSIVLFSVLTIILNKYFCFKTDFIILMLLFYSIGALEYLYVSHSIENRFSGYADKEVVIKGYIIDEPDIKGQKVSYIVKTYGICSENINVKTRGRILVTSLLSKKSSMYTYGQGVEIRGQLKIPKVSRNPGGFDYKRYLAASGISATVFAREDNIRLLNNSQQNPIVRTGLFIRNKIVYVIDKSLPEEQAGLLNGMLIGRRSGLSKEAQNAFSDAGLSHIMAVSGANIAFIIFPLAFMFKKLKLRKNLSNVIIIIILILFVYITGFSPAVVRAVIMAVIVLLAQILKREADIFTSIALSAMVLLLYNPYVLFDIGFQLSFGATASLILFYKTIKDKMSFNYIPGVITDLIAVTLAAQIGVIPLTVYYFNKISIISFVSNIFAVPLTGVITVTGFIMVIFGQVSLVFSQIVGYINNTLLTFILYVTKISSELPFAVLKVVTPHIVLIILYYAAVLFILWYKPRFKPQLKISPLHYVIICTCVIGIMFIYRILPGKLEVVFVDVGQGDCTFIKSYSGNTVLIDAGGSSVKTGSESNVGENTVMPFLLDYGVYKIDTVIATHGHDDHIQGLIPILEEMSVGKLVIPDIYNQVEFKQLLDIAADRKIPVYRCSKNDTISLDDKTYFEVAHPDKKFKIDKSASNNGSLVLKLHYGKVAMLFAGDIEKEVEDMLLESNRDLKADILKVAHHGSIYSTDEEFLEAVKPAAAVISVGKNNFGHPADVVLKRLQKKGIKYYRTDDSGGLILSSDGVTIRIKRTIGEEK